MIWLIGLGALALALVLAILHSGKDHPHDGADDQPAGPQVPAPLTGPCYVVDGDTVRIRGHAIRLAGIDAPELDHPYGKKAKLALMALCRGQSVRAEFDGSSTHDRLVATCYLPDGRDLSAEMVRQGHAVDWKKYSGGRYRHLETADARARLWRCDARQKGRFPPPGSARAG